MELVAVHKQVRTVETPGRAELEPSGLYDGEDNLRPAPLHGP